MIEQAIEKILFLDTETTGREKEDRIFQLAFSYKGKRYSDLCKPPVPISIEAMEATHYTNKDVKDKPPFNETESAKILRKILDTDKPIVVAHNAPFDIEMLKKEGIVIRKYIDTLRVAKHLDPQGKLPFYRLQYLRYALDLDVERVPAHDALSDVIVLEALFKRLYRKLFKELGSTERVLKKMQELSVTPVEIKILNFGKYKGKSLKEVFETDPQYISWLYSEKLKEKNSQSKDEQLDDWLFTLEKYIRML